MAKLKKIALWGLKILVLVLVAGMLYVLWPEMIYNLGPKTPLLIENPAQLDENKITSSTFVSIAGKPDFSMGFIYKRYGLSHTYFNMEPYGLKLVVRTYDAVDDDWKQLKRVVGRLRPFSQQPFSYHIRDIYRDRFKVEIPRDAYFLALDNVPKLTGWLIAAFSFASLMWLVMFYFFFFYQRKKNQA